MAFKRDNLTIVGNNAKAGEVPTLWLYWNEASDNAAAAGFFTDKRLAVGDQIDVLVAAFTSITRYRVSAVTEGAATVVASATGTYNPGGVSTRTDAGVIDVTNEVTLLVTTGARAMSLADGVAGQRKVLKMKTDGGDATVTPASFADGTTIVFDTAGDVVELVFADAKWQVINNEGTTIA